MPLRVVKGLCLGDAGFRVSRDYASGFRAFRGFVPLRVVKGLCLGDAGFSVSRDYMLRGLGPLGVLCLCG